MSCAQECVKYRTCGVAIYYPQSQICSLYDEDSSLGQISTIGTEESFVLAMNIRQPQSHSLTTQSSWPVNATMISGNPSGSFGTSLTELHEPTVVLYNKFDKILTVSDNYNYRVIKFDANNLAAGGTIIEGGNGWGSSLNQLSSVNGVYFDYLYTKKLYVTDPGNTRVVAFPANSTSSTNGVIVAGTTTTPGNASNQLYNPRNIVVDKYGTVYVADGYNCRIQRWLTNSTAGDTVAGGACGSNTNQIGLPEFVLFDEDYNLIVSDRTKNRILVYNFAN